MRRRRAAEQARRGSARRRRRQASALTRQGGRLQRRQGYVLVALKLLGHLLGQGEAGERGPKHGEAGCSSSAPP